MLKVSGVLFFITLIFVYSSSAQIVGKIEKIEKTEKIEKNNLQTESEKPEASFFAKSRKQVGLGKNPFAEGEKDAKPFESRAFRDLQVKKDEKDTKEPSEYKLRRGEKEWNFEFGYSPFEPTHFTGEKEYNTAGRKLGLPVFRWGRVIGTKGPITWEYLFEVIPFLFSLKNEVTNRAYVSPTETPNESPTKRETSYGFGLTPAAFRLYFLPEKRFKPFLQFGAGFIITNKPMPLPETSWFNFTSYWGGGAMYQIKRDRAVTFSYRYFHISNASITRNNPGYNANVFALGYSFFYGK